MFLETRLFLLFPSLVTPEIFFTSVLSMSKIYKLRSFLYGDIFESPGQSCRLAVTSVAWQWCQCVDSVDSECGGDRVDMQTTQSSSCQLLSPCWVLTLDPGPTLTKLCCPAPGTCLHYATVSDFAPRSSVSSF